MRGSTEFLAHQFLGPRQNFVFRQSRGIEDGRIRRRFQRGRRSGTVATVAVAQFSGNFSGSGLRQTPLQQSPLFPDHGISIKENFHIGIREDFSPDIATLHHYAAGCSHLLLAGDHPFTDPGMHRNPRRAFGHIGFPHPLRDVPPVKKNPVSGRSGLKLDAGFPRQLQQRSLIVEPYIPLNRLERQRTVHGAAFQVGIAEPAGQTGGDSALAGSGGTVNRHNQFARLGSEHPEEQDCTRWKPTAWLWPDVSTISSHNLGSGHSALTLGAAGEVSYGVISNTEP